MKDYYRKKLAASRLRKCYEVAPPRVRQYLEAEVNHVLKRIGNRDIVLELGCGYGRVLPRFASEARQVVGIDSSLPSLKEAAVELGNISNCTLAAMNAKQLGFRDNTFDAVICIQNGISAFHVDQQELIAESLRVVKSGGIVMFSTYAEKFWKHRLDWGPMVVLAFHKTPEKKFLGGQFGHGSPSSC